MTIGDYQRKRDFRRSPEPSAERRSGLAKGELRFVVQKHDARNLHFDLRLEQGGVLKSWAVPRGPSLDPSVKRLAVEVEDHPLSYADFEGVIPQGQYGAGQVLVWDTGTWQPHGDAEKMLRSGKLKFQLQGRRLRGDWLLVRTGMSGKQQQQWLLSKRADAEARPEIDVVALHPGSVLSAHASKPAGSSPDFISPKLPTLTSSPPHGTQWVHELKMDGYRMQAQWRANGFKFLTRNGHDWTNRYQAIADEFSKLDFEGTIFDGELTALQEDGRSNFDVMQQRSGYRPKTALAYFAFDLLYLRGVDQRDKPLLKRKAVLKQLIAHAQAASQVLRLQYLDHVTSGVDQLIAHCQAMSLEGIVSKRSDCGYSSGRASDWLKTKFRFRENLIIVGYETAGKNAALSSLLVAYFGENNQLKFAGRVGTGWNEKSAFQLLERLSALSTQHSPLAAKLSTTQQTRDRNVQLFWVQPILVGEVAFANWTEGQQLRQASFVGTNDDVSPQDVTAAQLFAEQGARHIANENVESSVAVNDGPPAQKGKKLAQISSRKPTNDLPGLSNPTRVLFPEDQFTKADIAAYLYQVNQWLLPHLENRPTSLLRCADGIDGQAFFQRHPGKGFPSQITSLRVESEDEPLISIDDVSSLLACIQISAIELHPWGCRSSDIEHPDRMIIDLDPDESLGWNKVVEAAFIVHSMLADHNLKSFVKTTGGKGLHLVVPLSSRHSWDEIFVFSKALAAELTNAHKNLFVDNMSKARRRDRIYLDYHRNRRGSTAVAAYSVRARKGAPVSTPVTWNELPSIHPAQFTIQTVPLRLAKINGDPWSGIGSTGQSLLT